MSKAKSKDQGMVYLASPYSHPDTEVRQARFDAVCKVASAIMLRTKRIVFSPIAHSHPILQYGLPTGWEFWAAFDEKMIDASSEIWVLTLDGYAESTGVDAEMKLANKKGKPVELIALKDFIDDAEPSADNLLSEANDLVDGARRGSHGPPEESFPMIAAMWTILFGDKLARGEDLDASDVSLAMIAVKLVRLTFKYTRDSAKDIAGYAKILARINEFAKEERT